MAAKERTTSQKHAELKQLGKTARDSLYRRLQLTDEILRDQEYVDQFGSEVKLMEIMEADEWSEFASRPGLAALLKIYRNHPEKEVWDEYRYDWAAIAELDKVEVERVERTDWRKECMERDLRIKELEAELRVIKSLYHELLSKLDRVPAGA